MKDLFLIPIVLAVLAFGYYMMAKFDRFVEENQRLIMAGNRNGQCKVRISAESPALLASVAPALESCSNAAPHIAFFLSSRKKTRLLEKLRAEQLDIVLLVKDHTEELGREYASVLIPCERTEAPESCFGLPAEDLKEGSWIQVVWNKSAKSKDRDRVIFALENGPWRLRCCYADYLD